MSTKIYNGFRFTTNDLVEIHHHIMAWRKRVNELTRERILSMLATNATAMIDKAALKGETAKTPLSTVLNKFWDEEQEIKKTGQRNPSVDFEFTISILPFNGSVYGIVYCEQHSWVTEFFNLGFTEDFCYYNNTDQPDHISDEEWEARRTIWDGITDADPLQRPVGCGFTAECHAPSFFPKVEQVLPFVAPMEDRIRSAANDCLLNRKCAELHSNNSDEDRMSSIMQVFFEAKNWLKSEEGQTVFNAEVTRITEENLLPEMTEEVLLGWSRQKEDQ